MNRPLIIMDMPALCGRSSFTYNGRYKDGYGNPANITFPIFQIIKSMMNRWETDRFFFCWDGDESYRQSILPSYTPKFHDVLSSESRQMHNLRDGFLFECGFDNHYTMPKHGSNDCIYNLAMAHKREEVVDRSFDEHLFHLFDIDFGFFEDFSIEVKNSKCLYAYDFVATYGISLGVWLKVMAIAGSTLHHMPGVPGVGLKGALRYVKSEANYKILHAIDENSHVVERNMELVVPVEDTPPVELPCRKRLDQIEKAIKDFGFTDSWTRKR